jgi:hypothetical protein
MTDAGREQLVQSNLGLAYHEAKVWHRYSEVRASLPRLTPRPASAGRLHFPKNRSANLMARAVRTALISAM